MAALAHPRLDYRRACFLSGAVEIARQRRAQKWAIVIGILGVLVVASSRLDIGAHYPADVLGSIIYTTSAMIGFLVIWNQWLVQPIERAMARRRAGHRA
jgi:membrane-associated phospholipid phosphatase